MTEGPGVAASSVPPGRMPRSITNPRNQALQLALPEPQQTLPSMTRSSRMCGWTAAGLSRPCSRSGT